MLKLDEPIKRFVIVYLVVGFLAQVGNSNSKGPKLNRGTWGIVVKGIVILLKHLATQQVIKRQ